MGWSPVAVFPFAKIHQKLPLALRLRQTLCWAGWLLLAGCSSQGGTIRLFPWQQNATIPPPATSTVVPGGDLSPTLGPANPYAPAAGQYAPPPQAYPPPNSYQMPNTGYSAPSYTPPATPDPNTYNSGYGGTGNYNAGNGGGLFNSPPAGTNPAASQQGFGGPPAGNSGSGNSFLPPLGPPSGADGMHTPHWGGQFPSTGFSYPQSASLPPPTRTGRSWWGGNLTNLWQSNPYPGNPAVFSGGRSGGDIFSRPVQGSYNPYANSSPWPATNQGGNYAGAGYSPGMGQTGNTGLGNPYAVSGGLAQTSPYGTPGGVPSLAASGNGPAGFNQAWQPPPGGSAPGNMPGTFNGARSGAAPSAPVWNFNQLPPATPQQMERDGQFRKVGYQPLGAEPGAARPANWEQETRSANARSEIQWRAPHSG